MTIRPGLLLFLILFVAGVSSPAAAQTVIVTVSGTFNSPATGSYSGSFEYDLVTETVVSASITATAGLDQYGAPIAAETYDAIGASRANVVALAATLPGTGNRGLTLIFDPDLNDPAPAIDSVGEGTCMDDACESLVVSRGGLGGTLSVAAAIPTLGEWAMILLALTLAGAAVLRLQALGRLQPVRIRPRG